MEDLVVPLQGSICVGWYITWHVTSQAGYPVTVTLEDDYQKYFQETADTQFANPPLAVGAEFVKGFNLRLRINVQQFANSSLLFKKVHCFETGEGAGPCGFVLFLTDVRDFDFKLLLVSVVAWPPSR